MRNDIKKVEAKAKQSTALIDVIKKRELLKPVLNKENASLARESFQSRGNASRAQTRDKAFERVS